MALTDVLTLRGARTTPSGVESFDAFAARTLGSSFRIASMIVGDAMRAENATHDAYRNAARRWRRLHTPDEQDAWFGRLLLKACRDQVRRGGRATVQDISGELVPARYRADAAGARVDRDAVPVADRDRTARAFARLGLDHRVTLVLRYGAELEVPQIAAWTRSPERVVRGRLREGLEAVGVSQRNSGAEIAA